MTESGKRLLAAPTLGERGGGVGQVSSLLWRTMQDEWGSQAELVTLLRSGRPAPSLVDKWRFGVSMAGRRVVAAPAWVLFAHLGLARVTRYLPALRNRPYAVFLHGIESWQPLSPEDREILTGATLRMANSAYTAHRTTEANPGIGAIDVCPLALPDSVTEGHDDGVGKASAPTALIVGRLSASERYKGHDELIDAWPEVSAIVPGARLIVVGDGDDLDRLRARAAAVSPDGIEFTGFLSRRELERRYREANVFVLPSRGEGFGVVYLEAMAAGLPCVGSTHDAAAEVVVDGETGRLVDPGDRHGMAEGIASLLRDPGRARAMGEAGRARVKAEFSYGKFRNRFGDLLRRSLDGAGTRQASAS